MCGTCDEHLWIHSDFEGYIGDGGRGVRERKTEYEGLVALTKGQGLGRGFWEDDEWS